MALLKKNVTAAEQWLNLAASQGDPSAQQQLGLHYIQARHSAELAEKWLRLAASNGHATAQNEMAMSLLTGSFGRPAEPGEAVLWLSLAASQGHALAQSNLGVCYVQGSGVEKSLPAALYWWLQAIQQGVPDAVDNLTLLKEDHTDWASWPLFIPEPW